MKKARTAPPPWFGRLYEIIAQVVEETPACAPFHQALGRCLRPTSSPLWAALPILSCEAVGGQPEHGLIVAAAFELARMAADVLDDVQDGDTDAGLWRELGAGQAINVGLGLTCAAHLALSRLRHSGLPEGLVALLQEDFARVGFEMCAGQYLDLLGEGEEVGLPDGLERCWQMAAAKSGAFFALGCQAGARLGWGDTQDVAPYAEFGHHLGLLAQVANDLAGLYGLGGKADLARRKKTLPLVYALSVAQGEARAQLEAACRAAVGDPTAQAQVRELVITLGAPQYLLLAAEDHYRRAAAALRRAHGQAEALAGLMGVLDHLRPLGDGGR